LPFFNLQKNYLKHTIIIKKCQTNWLKIKQQKSSGGDLQFFYLVSAQSAANIKYDKSAKISQIQKGTSCGKIVYIK
jgi:hypothetical protein